MINMMIEINKIVIKVNCIRCAFNFNSIVKKEIIWLLKKRREAIKF